MPSYIKASLERSYADSFLSELERNENQYFFFIAKSSSWTNENSPDSYTDTVGAEYTVMNSVIAYKKLSAQNILYALPRYEWNTGTVYDQYDDTVNLFDPDNPKIFYVVTKTAGGSTHIYKCISNNSGGRSTEQPTLTQFSTFTLSDGYTWKYVGSVRESEIPYELTDYVPVDYAYSEYDTETTQQYSTQLQAVSGEITRFVISSYPGGTVGVYPNTITGKLGSNSYCLNVTSVTTVSSGVYEVTITDTASRSRISGNASNYIGYVMRVDQNHTTVPAERGNYGVIRSATINANDVKFRVVSDVGDFVCTPTITGGGGSARSSVEIIPYIKVVGDGSGAFAYPVMNSSNQISKIEVGSGGRDYSRVYVEVVSPKSSSTNHPSIRAVLPPKGGHGSNILKELNVKDVLIVCEILESDSSKIISGGSYRQFGIIKNPVVNDGSGTIAGKTDLYFRDIVLAPVNGPIETANFDGGPENLVLGRETYSSSRVVLARTPVSAGLGTGVIDTISLKTVPSNGKYVTRQDRRDDYTITLSAAMPPNANFQVGERVRQVIPAGTPVSNVTGNTVAFTYSITVEGTVISVGSTELVVRLTTGGNFVSGSVPIVGLRSAASSLISSILPRFGETVWITKKGSAGIPEFQTYNGEVKQYKVVETGLAYFDQDAAPVYSGLHTLRIGTSVNSSVGGVDISYAPLTPNSFTNGETIHQGVTGAFGHYATGKVYNWDFVNSSSGTLYLTEVQGSFRSVATHGLSGSTLSAYVVTGLSLPEISPSSGEVLYINNVRPVQRVVGQEDEFRIRLGF